jgi:hypothetical protein
LDLERLTTDEEVVGSSPTGPAMITVTCARCNENLDEPGGLLFTPPKDDVCTKMHLCVICIERVVFDIIVHSTTIKEQ